MVTTAPSGSSHAEPVVVRLPPELHSVRQARDRLAEVARQWGCGDEIVADARLVLSELMSNGALHARTELQVTIQPRHGGGLRIEVRDLSSAPVLPPLALPRGASNLLDRPDSLDDALAPELPNATGRGLHLVAALSTNWGWFPEAGSGKTVWAELGPSVRSGEDEDRSYSEQPPYPLRPVRVIAVPVRLVKESEDHFDDLFRELQMARTARHQEPVGDLVAKAELVRSRLSRMREPARRALWEAMRRGDRLIDINLLADTGIPAILATTEELLGQAARASVAGLLLTEGPPPEVNEWRRWLRSELEGQIAGKPPRACPFPVTSPLEMETGPAWARLDKARRQVLADVKARLAADQNAVATGKSDEEAASPLERILECAISVLGASRGALNLLDQDNETVRFAASVGFSPAVTSYWETFPVSADLPSCEVIRTAKPVLFRTFAELDERYPVFLSSPSESDPAVACVPMLPTGSSTAIGSLVFGFPLARDFNPTEVSFMSMLATEMSDYLVAQRHRADSARAWQRERDVEAASQAISSAIDKQAMVDEFLRAVVALVADGAAVHVVDGKGQMHYLGSNHRDPQRQRGAEALYSRQGSGSPYGDLVASCAATGEVTVIQVLSEGMLDTGPVDAEDYDLVRKLAIGSVAILPLRARGHLVGVVSVSKEPGRYVSEDDLAVTAELAGQLGDALAHMTR